MSNDKEKIQITWEDIDQAQVPDPVPVAIPVAPSARGSAAKSWGAISPTTPSAASQASTGGSLLLRGWFYLGAAGFVGAFLAWILCEPSFEDEGVETWGNVMLFPLMATLMCVSLGTVESLVERSWFRAFMRGLAASGLGLVFGFIFNIVANLVFGLLLGLLGAMGAANETLASNPAFWLVRALAWAAFGMAGGLIFGIVSKSGKKTSYGMLGGVIGAAIGGLLFDPISLLTQGGEASRAIGMSIVGASTGIAIGLVESALKDRWLYVAAGPLAGKQFVLYQPLVTIGKDPSSTIYLFKDPGILDMHATIEHRAGRSVLTAAGPVVVAGRTVQPQTQYVLNSGDSVQIGRYTFSYAERERSKHAP